MSTETQMIKSKLFFVPIKKWIVLLKTVVLISVFSFVLCFYHKVAPKIKALMMESGTTMVGYQPQGDKANFFRMVISNPAATQSDIDFLIEEIERLGQDL